MHEKLLDSARELREPQPSSAARRPRADPSSRTGRCARLGCRVSEVPSADEAEYVLIRQTASKFHGLAEVRREAVKTLFGTAEQYWLHFIDATETSVAPARVRPEDLPGGAATCRPISCPASLLAQGQLRGSIEAVRARLEAYWLRAENRHGQLDNDPVRPLRHQEVLVEFLHRDPAARRLLVADEVGLGKTIEMALLLRRLFREDPDLRVAYVTRGGLVSNVVDEFVRLGFTNFYLYANAEIKGDAASAFVTMPSLLPAGKRFVVSIHKLGHGKNADKQWAILGDTRFDMVIVDECHNLRAYASSDGPAEQKFFRVIRRLLEKHVTPEGRVYFLSGTPHQGNSEVFLNLGALLCGLDGKATAAERRTALNGKVVFRIKEEIVDWDDKPLFPRRDVQPVTSVSAPANYRELLDDIGHYFDAAAEAASSSSARGLAFVKSQALQFAASSPKAGFAYLLRRYVRYFLAADSRSKVLGWVEQVVPYRDREDWTAKDILAEWELPAAENDDDDDDALSDDVGALGADSERLRLRALLDRYSEVLREPAARAKFDAVARLVEQHDEPFVIFSQALDTVYDLRRRFIARGIDVELIVGGQSPGERAAAIRRFREGVGRRVLVSSAAGTEGLNLQVARRIVHFDLPWNPMVLEQRVGRVHRIGSVDTILIDTILLEGSRERDIYERLDLRLREIVKSLAESPEDQARLYRRILTGIEADELKRFFEGARDPDDLGALVAASRESVRRVDEELGGARARIAEADRGRATMDHLVRALLGRQVVVRGTERLTYTTVDYDAETQKLARRVMDVDTYRGGARVLVFDRSAAAMLQRTREETGGLGNGLVDDWFRQASRVEDERAYELRSVVWMKAPKGMDLPAAPGAVLVYATALVGTEGGATVSAARELRMRAFALGSTADARELSGAELERLVWDAQWAAAGPSPMRADLVARDRELRSRLREQGGGSATTRCAVWPLAAIGYRS